jgi:putative ATPase
MSTQNPGKIVFRSFNMDSVAFKYSTPLAERLRPVTLEEYLGQDHILAPGKMLREAIEKDNIPSFILWGPPGSGKTTLARIVRKKSSAHFTSIAAVTSGVKDVRQIIKEAEIRKKSFKQKTILFVDEIHRFNKAQQDAFLPHVEKGTITLIGATTENPYFEVIPALLSRARVYRLEPLIPDNIKQVVEKAISDKERGLGELNLKVDEDAVDLLVNSSGGDARIALNALETAALVAVPDEENIRRITPDQIFDSLQKKRTLYDKSGEEHYNTISAFIKSIRGSDPDASLYWLARMLYNGEDPKFIARRLVILASEDIGLADPFALNIANAASNAVQFVGMPEARITLAEATVYLATAPKSNSAYAGINKALEVVEKNPTAPIPYHLRNAVTSGMKEMGYGKDYKYSHDFPGHFADQQYLPDELVNERFYHPGELGHEKKIRLRLQTWWNDRFE